jgi:hypothetical protein
VDPSDNEVTEDDLDGRGYDEGGDLDFGPEPYGNVIDAWGCHHLWSLVIRTNPSSVRRHLECNRCFRVVQPAAQDEPQPNIDLDMDVSGMAPSWPSNHYGEPGWQCFSGHLACRRCPKLAPAHRQGDANWSWTCDCGMSCVLCDKVEAMMKHANNEKLIREQKEKEDSIAWECRCGMVLCGTCKIAAELT